MTFDAIVVGAGIHGRCAAFHLRRRGLRTALVERFRLDHDQGSSHGASRITRSSYHDPLYVRLAAEAHRDGWPLLERELGAPLLHRTPGLFFGPPRGRFGDYLRATLGAGVAVEAIDAGTARARFPLLRIHDGDAALLDHTAALIAARDAMRGLLDWCRSHDVEVHESCPVAAIRPEPDAIRLATAHGELRAQRVVLACGPWLADLAPHLRSQARVVPQQVGYAAVAAAPAACRPGVFPVWARIGDAGADDFTYGLPAFQRPGLKFAVHRTAGPHADPSVPHPQPDRSELTRLAQQVFAVAAQVVDAECCRYTVAPEEALRVEPHPADARIAVVAACSGHGFKFGPVIGRMAADRFA